MNILIDTPVPRLRKLGKRGFTLIEIMVATVIMIILTGLVIQITSEVLKVWNRSTGKLSANAQARIAMDLLTQDLETAVFGNENMQWLRAEQDTLVGPADSQTATVAMRLFSPALDRPSGPNDAGDICAIAYKLDYRNPVTGSAAADDPDDRLFILYRLVVDPEETFTNLMGAAQLPDHEASTWGTQSIVGTSGANYLVSNIVQFHVDFYVEDDGDNGTPTKVSGNTILGGTDSTVGAGAIVPAGLHFKKPLAYAEITLTVISDEGAQLLQNVSRINQDVDSIIREHGEVFTRRVNFPSRSL